MKIYELPEPKEYESFVNFYRDMMREGKEEEAFLGTKSKNIVYGNGILMNLIVQTF